MDFVIDEPPTKKFYIKDLEPGHFFEWQGTVYQKVILAINIENLLKTPTLHKDKIFVVSVLANQVSYFDRDTQVTLLNYTPVHFTRVV